MLKKKQFLNCGLILFWGKAGRGVLIKVAGSSSNQRMAPGQKLGVPPLFPSRFSCDVWHHPRDSSCHIILHVTEPSAFPGGSVVKNLPGNSWKDGKFIYWWHDLNTWFLWLMHTGFWETPFEMLRTTWHWLYEICFHKEMGSCHT